MNTTLDLASPDTLAPSTRASGLGRRIKLAAAALAMTTIGFTAASSAASAASPAAAPELAPAPAAATANMSACIQAPWRSGGVTYWGAYGAYPVIVDIYLNGRTVSSTFRTGTNGCITITGLSVGSGASYRLRVYSRLGACTYVGQTGWLAPSRAINYTFGTVRVSAIC